MKVVVVFVVAFAALTASAVPVADNVNKEPEDFVTSALGRAIKTLSNVQNIASQPNIEILPGVVLESDNPASIRESRQLMNTDLPFTADERLTKMFDMMYDIFNNFFSGRTLKVKIPKVSSDDAMRALDEGRKLKKKMMMNPLFMAIAAKMVLLVPLLLGGLALLAVKAAVISKIALVLALVAGAGSIFGGGGLGGGLGGGFGGKDLFGKLGGGGGGWNGGNGWTSGGYQNSYSPAWNSVASGGPYARSGEATAQDIAYSAQKP